MYVKFFKMAISLTCVGDFGDFFFEMVIALSQIVPVTNSD